MIASLNVESLFANIPLEETISVCCDSLFSNDTKVYNINRIDFEKILRAALQINFSNLEGKMYKKFDRVAMRSPLGSTLGKVFLCFYEQRVCILVVSDLHSETKGSRFDSGC